MVVAVRLSIEYPPCPSHFVQLTVQSMSHPQAFSSLSLKYHDSEQQQLISQRYERADENDTKFFQIYKY